MNVLFRNQSVLDVTREDFDIFRRWEVFQVKSRKQIIFSDQRRRKPQSFKLLVTVIKSICKYLLYWEVTRKDDWLSGIDERIFVGACRSQNLSPVTVVELTLTIGTNDAFRVKESSLCFVPMTITLYWIKSILSLFYYVHILIYCIYPFRVCSAKKDVIKARTHAFIPAASLDCIIITIQKTDCAEYPMVKTPFFFDKGRNCITLCYQGNQT